MLHSTRKKQSQMNLALISRAHVGEAFWNVLKRVLKANSISSTVHQKFSASMTLNKVETNIGSDKECIA